ncbi:MAG: ribosome maturation factor RimM [Burkholderiales bacterium]
MSKKLPERLVGMGRISAPFGIKGWVRVQPFAETADGLTNYSTWWLGSEGDWREYNVEQAQVQGTDVIAKLVGIDDRDVAAGFKGRQVAIPRQAFPPAEQGEYYWADLVGLSVKNSAGLDFGVVTAMIETGANAVLVVQQVVKQVVQQSAVDGEKVAEERERLIPFIADVVKRVDIAAGVIEVEWGADY